MKSNTGKILGAVAIVIVIIATLVFMNRGKDTPLETVIPAIETPVTTPDPEDTNTPPTTEPSETPVTSDASENVETSPDTTPSGPENTEQTATSDSGISADGQKPTFDVVRIDNSGTAVVAGTAAPNSTVTIKSSGKVLGEAVADSAGQFVAILDTNVETAADTAQTGNETEEVAQTDVTKPVSNTVVAGNVNADNSVETAVETVVETVVETTTENTVTPEDKPDTTVANNTATPAVVEPAVSTSAAVTTESPETAVNNADETVPVDTVISPSDTIAEVATETVADTNAVSPTSAPVQNLTLEAEVDGTLQFSNESILILPTLDAGGVDAAANDAAPTIVKETAGEIVVIQPGGQLIVDQISIDSVSYNARSEAVIAGRGAPDHSVVIYVDNVAVAKTDISSGGTWKTVLNGVEAGNYTLRADEIDAEGKVTSRMETPFQRAFPADVRDAQAKGDVSYTVQPGNSLWVIATGRYGDGMQYHQIFGANRDQIRDPDLIYPGQVFVLPEVQE